MFTRTFRLGKTIGPEIRNDDHQRFIYLIIALADSHGARETNYKLLHIVMRFLTHRAQDNFFMCMPRCLSQVSRAYVMSVVSFTCMHQISSKHVAELIRFGGNAHILLE